MALQAGADGWLAKPFVVAEFVFKVADLLAGVA
jgi:DNA-binding response OmpR family regulator